MNEHMQLDMVIIVGQRQRGKWRRKRLPYITIKSMTFAEYHAASDIILTGLDGIAQSLHDAGYTMEFRGEQVMFEDKKSG